MNLIEGMVETSIDVQCDKQRRFARYDFEDDENWLIFVSRVIPEPQPDQIKRLKRRWYKIYVDFKFDAENFDAYCILNEKVRTERSRAK